MEQLHVSLIQTDLIWENPEKNRQKFSELIAQTPAETDLILLPEMFSTGFSMSPESNFESMNGNTHQWMVLEAQKKNCVVTGSFICQDNGKYYNRLLWVRPDGTYETYDKRHLFSLAGEEKHYTAGSEQLLVELKGFKIMPLICYDLRFPVWSRNTMDYDVLLYVANWPEIRSFFWIQLLTARAIENQSYVLGLNRCGDDGNGMPHSGNSRILDPLGGIIQEANDGKEAILSAVLTKSELNKVRQKFQFLNDRDDFKIV